MTRAKILLIGLAILLLGGVSNELFKAIGFEGASAGIAAEATLMLLVLLWTISYLFRVITGNMTFMEQRKRYRKAYEEIKTEELKKTFDELSEEEQTRLINELER